MILDPDTFMERVTQMRNAGIRRSDDSMLMEYWHNDNRGEHIFQVFHMIPPQSDKERQHEYSVNCWCHPDTDGHSFLHMRAH
jgi:hypothetical protein